MIKTLTRPCHVKSVPSPSEVHTCFSKHPSIHIVRNYVNLFWDPITQLKYHAMLLKLTHLPPSLRTSDQHQPPYFPS